MFWEDTVTLTFDHHSLVHPSVQVAVVPNLKKFSRTLEILYSWETDGQAKKTEPLARLLLWYMASDNTQQFSVFGFLIDIFLDVQFLLYVAVCLTTQVLPVSSAELHLCLLSGVDHHLLGRWHWLGSSTGFCTRTGGTVGSRQWAPRRWTSPPSSQSHITGICS